MGQDKVSSKEQLLKKYNRMNKVTQVYPTLHSHSSSDSADFAQGHLLIFFFLFCIPALSKEQPGQAWFLQSSHLKCIAVVKVNNEKQRVKTIS